MPITIAEKLNGRSGDKDRRQVKYFVRGTDDDSEAIFSVRNSTVVPTIWDGLPQRSVVVEPLSDQLWEANVNYSKSEGGGGGPDPPTGSITYSFETGAENVHVTHSLQTVHRYVQSGSPHDYKQGMNVQDDGSYEGTDILMPVSTFSYTFKFAAGLVTEAYIRSVEAAVATWNSVEWRARPAGEVLLMGVSGSQGTSETPSIQFRFKRQPNVSGLTIGDISGISKQGWDYLWVATKDEEQGQDNDKKIISVPKQVNVERVLRSSNFSTILGF